MTQKNLITKLANRELKHVKSDMFIDFNRKYLEMPIIVNGRDVVEGVLCNRYGGEGYLVVPSPQIGCSVGCKFCDMSDLPYKKNLSADVILEQIALILNRGLKAGYKVTEKPLKVSFVKGGEGLMNRDFPRALELIAENLDVPIKVSTTFPDLEKVHSTYREVEAFASSYPQTTQMQVSLISTNDDFRREMVRIPLIPFNKLRKYAESWRENVQNPRKMTLSLTLTKNTPCNPREIVDVLSSEYFAVRIRDWIPTKLGLNAGLLDVSTSESDEVKKRFEDCGYQIIPGKPGSTERDFQLTAGHLIKLYKMFKNRRLK